MTQSHSMLETVEQQS